MRGSACWCVTLWSPQRWLLSGNSCACSSCICSRPSASVSSLLTGTWNRLLSFTVLISVLVLPSPDSLIFDCWHMWIQQLFPQPKSFEELYTQTLTIRSLFVAWWRRKVNHLLCRRPAIRVPLRNRMKQGCWCEQCDQKNRGPAVRLISISGW